MLVKPHCASVDLDLHVLLNGREKYYLIFLPSPLLGLLGLKYYCNNTNTSEHKAYSLASSRDTTKMPKKVESDSLFQKCKSFTVTFY